MKRAATRIDRPVKLRLTVSHNNCVRVFEQPVDGVSAEIAAATDAGVRAFSEAFNAELASRRREAGGPLDGSPISDRAA